MIVSPMVCKKKKLSALNRFISNPSASKGGERWEGLVINFSTVLSDHLLLSTYVIGKISIRLHRFFSIVLTHDPIY